MAGCMLSEDNAVVQLLHVLKCVGIQSCKLKMPKQPVKVGNALDQYMFTTIVLLLAMVLLQGWD